MLPFTADQFLDVFEIYHAAWPHAVTVLTALALLTVVLAAVKIPKGNLFSALILSFFWFWSGAAYHFAYFTTINAAAYIFGSMFLVQGAILLIIALRSPGFSFELRADLRGFAAAVLIIYAVVIYPIVGSILGHSYPRAPSFGLPCPVTIFTFGMLLWDRTAFRWYAISIPVLWVFIGSSAAVFFGIWQDLGLLAALIAFIAVTASNPLWPRFVPSA